jgi:Na+-transporting NADH:ubiquinone oxidoreductase subunit C
VRPELFKEKATPVLFMAGVTFVAISLIGIVDIATRQAVDRNKTLFQKQAVCDAAGVDRPATSEGLVSWYSNHVVEVAWDENMKPTAYKVTGENGATTLVVVQPGPGLWGTIVAYVGFNRESGGIAGVTFPEQVETPGLGARIDEEWFRNQFVGKTGPFAQLNAEPKDKSKGSTDPAVFDQITGATITSTAVKDIINRSIERSRALAAGH